MIKRADLKNDCRGVNWDRSLTLVLDCESLID